MRLLMVVLFCFATAMIEPAVAQSPPDISKMTRKQFEALPKEQQKKFPAFPVFALLLRDKKTTPQMAKSQMVVVVEDALYELRFYPHLPTGQENPKLQTAIRNFQRSAGFKPTGILLLGEMEEMMRRQQGLANPPIYLPSSSFFAARNWVVVRGTFKFRAGKIAGPIQTTEIQCIRARRVCTMATAKVLAFGKGSDMAQLDLDLRDWAITKWTSTEVVAEDDSPTCLAYTLTVSLKRKKALMFRRPKGGERCKMFKSKSQILELVDGFKVAYSHYSQIKAERSKLYSPEYRKQALELFEKSTPRPLPKAR